MYALYDFAPSPFCLKIRAIFDVKGVDYRRVDVRGPAWLALKARSRTGQVPALVVDGRWVSDSTAIAALLDERHPEPPLWPQTPRLRARCHLLEDWADESLYWYGLYYRWQHRDGIRTAGAAFPPGTRLAAAAVIGAGARKRRQGLGRRHPDRVVAELDEHLSHFANLFDGDWLLGDSPFLCDFAMAAQLLYVARTPYGGPRVEAHPQLTAYLERFRQLRSSRRKTHRGRLCMVPYARNTFDGIAGLWRCRRRKVERREV